MQIKKLKVRPRKGACTLPSACSAVLMYYSHCPVKNMTTCGPALATMLGCMAAHGDVHTMGPCQEAAQALFHCMRTTVRLINTAIRPIH